MNSSYVSMWCARTPPHLDLDTHEHQRRCPLLDDPDGNTVLTAGRR
jgi:hypothetical protein